VKIVVSLILSQEICNASNPNKFLYIAYALTPQSNLK